MGNLKSLGKRGCLWHSWKESIAQQQPFSIAGGFCFHQTSPASIRPPPETSSQNGMFAYDELSGDHIQDLF